LISFPFSDLLSTTQRFKTKFELLSVDEGKGFHFLIGH